MVAPREVARVLAVVVASTFLSGGLAVQAAPREAEALYFEGQPPGIDKKPLIVELPKFSELAKVVSPAVVNISTLGVARAELSLETPEEDQSESPFGASPTPAPSPGLKKPQPRNPQSIGSGFLISPKGYIVTNGHVIKDAKKILIRRSDERRDYEATVVGRDEKTDLALLKIEAGRELPYMRLGNSDDLEVGEWVVAVGNQFQLGQSVTAGIVSAKGRRVNSRDSRPYDSYIQTDAPINPGSSGGPLINTRGQVVGVNTAIFSPGREGIAPGFNIGIGFSIPINMVKDVIHQIYDKGRVTRAFLGVVVQPVSSEITNILKLEGSEGALVADVLPDSPAARAGFKRRDVIVEFDGQKVEDRDDLPVIVAHTKVGKTVPTKVIRGGLPVVLQAKVEELADERKDRVLKESQKPNKLGLVLDSVDVAIAKALNLPLVDGEAHGALVKEVEPLSVAADAGFLVGDVIVEFSTMKEVLEVRSVAGVESVIGELPATGSALVLVRRKDGTRYLTLIWE